MHFRLITVGKLREAYLRNAEEAYLSRLPSSVRFEVTELNAARHSAHPEQVRKIKEGEDLLSRLKPSEYVIALEEQGKELGSVEFADFLQKKANESVSNFVFLIGGASGLDKAVVKRANLVLSLSRMTFPHQLCRVILVEQIYRALSILNGTSYHK